MSMLIYLLGSIIGATFGVYFGLIQYLNYIFPVSTMNKGFTEKVGHNGVHPPMNAIRPFPILSLFG